MEEAEQRIAELRVNYEARQARWKMARDSIRDHF
jgi:hypothetical protein